MSKQITVRLPASLAEFVEKQARLEDRPLASCIRRILAEAAARKSDTAEAA